MNPFISSKDFFENTTFSGLTLTNESLKNREFENCIFEKCIFISSNFEGCKFIDCQFNGCSISANKPLKSTFMNSKFKNSKVLAFDWTMANTIQLLEFEDCDISMSDFTGLKLHHLKIISSTAKEVNFSHADLTESIFTKTDFEKSIFSQTNLTKADFRKAFNYSIDFHHNTLKKTKFSLPEAISLLSSLDISIE